MRRLRGQGPAQVWGKVNPAPPGNFMTTKIQKMLIAAVHLVASGVTIGSAVLLWRFGRALFAAATGSDAGIGLVFTVLFGIFLWFPGAFGVRTVWRLWTGAWTRNLISDLFIAAIWVSVGLLGQFAPNFRGFLLAVLTLGSAQIIWRLIVSRLFDSTVLGPIGFQFPPTSPRRWCND